MKNLLTNNIGLKILSVISAILLWIIVVNIDNPVISRAYSGVPVEIVNSSAITSEGKTFEVADDSDVITVVISAERSIIEDLTKDNIKAVADMKNITFMNTVPIELKTTRYYDKLESIQAKTPNLSVVIEEKEDKQIKLSINTEGSVAKGYIAGEIKPVVDVVKVSGPKSKVSLIDKAQITVDYSDMNESFTTSCPVVLYDVEGNVVDDPIITSSKTEIRTSVEILETKEIPVTASYVGTAANGFSATGMVICEPSSIVVAGKGSAFENISSVKIPEEYLSVDGAIENKTETVNIKELLPKGVVLADKSFNGDVSLVAVVEAHDTVVVELPVKNIEVINLPENYIAHVVYGEEKIPFEVSGLKNDLLTYAQSEITAVIDANTLSPRETKETEDDDTTIQTGSNDGLVLLNLPQGMSQISNTHLEVVITHQDNKEKEE